MKFSLFVLALVAGVAALADVPVVQVGTLLGDVNVEEITSYKVVEGGQTSGDKVDQSITLELSGTYNGYPGSAIVGELVAATPGDYLYAYGDNALVLKLHHVAPQSTTLYSTYAGGAKPIPTTPHLPFTVRVQFGIGMFFSGSSSRLYGHAKQTAVVWDVVVPTFTYSWVNGLQQKTSKPYGVHAVVDFVGNAQWHEQKGWTITPIGFQQNP